MGFPCRKLNGEVVDILEKSHDENGTEIFKAVDGSLYTRALSNGGDPHALVDYTEPPAYSERNDADLVVEEATGPSQADVDSTALANAGAADVPGGPTVPNSVDTPAPADDSAPADVPADSGTDTAAEAPADEPLAGEGEQFGGEVLPAA